MTVIGRENVVSLLPRNSVIKTPGVPVNTFSISAVGALRNSELEVLGLLQSSISIDGAVVFEIADVNKLLGDQCR